MKRAIWMVAFLAACGTDAPDVADAGTNGQVSDGGPGADISIATDMGTTAADVSLPLPDMTLQPLAPDEYCEETVDMFCDYYLRCGRIAADSLADCQTNFLQTCNAAYEPQYAALAADGRLELSRDGIATCAAHLSDVACERHIFDLDGPCSDVWVGQSAVDEPCAPGIGSFVCGSGSTCVLDLSFCGTCQAAGALGESCVDNRCETGASCIDGTCAPRGLPGDSCDDENPCVVGVTCAGGSCQPMNIVDAGDACNAVERCPYQTTCLGSVCVQDALLGENCSDSACASGWCDGTICREFIPIGDGCSEGFQCLSQQCMNGVCGGVVSTCFTN